MVAWRPACRFPKCLVFSLYHPPIWPGILKWNVFSFWMHQHFLPPNPGDEAWCWVGAPPSSSSAPYLGPVCWETGCCQAWSHIDKFPNSALLAVILRKLFNLSHFPLRLWSGNIYLIKPYSAKHDKQVAWLAPDDLLFLFPTVFSLLFFSLCSLPLMAVAWIATLHMYWWAKA